MSADRWIDVEDLISDEIGICVWDPDGQREAAQRVLTALIDMDLLVEPDTWAMPPEPGPEVTAVYDRTGARWVRELHQDEQGSFSSWRDGSPLPPYGWLSLVQLRGPLTDASHPTAAAPAGAEPPAERVEAAAPPVADGAPPAPS